jgi:hypothetical protein
MLQFLSIATGSSFRDSLGCAILPIVSTMISEVYDALIAAGAPEDKARKAAETLANYDNRFSRIDGGFLKVQSKLLLLKWMVGFGIAMNVAILSRLFFH